jgi:N-hydroxyarylamine O-acetyltransferase
MNAVEARLNTMEQPIKWIKDRPADRITGDRLPEDLLERVLTRLGINRIPEPTLESLTTVYHAWCRCVPFDNVRKLIHVRSGNAGPLPASTAVDFFEGWLKFGTGGTCWAGAGATHALLLSLGFNALRAIGTMLVNPVIPPNHGTVFVRFHERLFLFDSSILHGAPLGLDEHTETLIEHPAWGVRCSQRNSKWHVSWRPLNRLDGFECRLDKLGVERHEFETRHEQIRPWSPFNYQLAARLNCGNDVIGVAFGHSVTLHGDGRITKVPHSDLERSRLLIEDLGLAEEIVARLPVDVPTPPPPGSATALGLMS